MNRFTYIDIIKDVKKGAENWRIWFALARNTIKMQYRRTVLGPFWITLQQTVLIVALGYIFASIQKENFASFFVYFAIGQTFWVLISSFVTSAGHTFVGINGLPYMTRAAVSNHIYLRFSGEMLKFFHNVIPLIVILVIFHKDTAINIPLFLCGFLLLMIFGFWVSALLGCLCLRFQDLGQAVTSIMQVMFFVTPVMYKSSRIPGGDKIADFNPFYNILVVIRGNLINEEITLFNWITVIIINIIGIIFTLWVLRKSRPKLAYWAG